MKKFLAIVFSAVFLGGCTPKNLFTKPPAGLQISAIPEAIVSINGENKGATPYEDKNLKPGKYTLKLTPNDPELLPYETSIDLVSGASTIINRNFAKSEVEAFGYKLELQEDISGGTYLSVISDPDNVNIFLDDKSSGYTPLSKLIITPGSHTLKVTSPGYLEQVLPINAVAGFNLIVNFKLSGQVITLAPPIQATSSAVVPSASPLASASPTSTPISTSQMQKPYVVIKETGTGWLRIRSEASGSSQELGKANTGEKLKYLGESTELGWFKIEFEGSTGWVSGKYVELVN